MFLEFHVFNFSLGPPTGKKDIHRRKKVHLFNLFTRILVMLTGQSKIIALGAFVRNVKVKITRISYLRLLF